MSSPDELRQQQAIRRLILNYGVATFAGALATRVTDPLVAEIAAEFAAPSTQVALLGTAFSLPYAFVQPVLAPVGDALGKGRIINGALFVLAAVLLACALAPSLSALMVFRALAGAAGGGVMPLTLAVMGDAVPMKDRQVAISRLLVFAITGQIAGGVVAGPVAALAGWRGVLALCAAFALAAALVLLRASRSAPPEEAARFDPALALRRYRGIVTNPAALTLYAAVAVEGMLVFGAFPFVAPLLLERGIGGTTEAGLTIGAFGLGGVGYAMAARTLLERIGQGRMVMLGGASAAAALLCFALAPAFAVMALGGFLLGMGFYMIHNSIQTRVTEVAPRARASAVSLHAFSFFTGQSLGPVLCGAGSNVIGIETTLAIAAVGIAALGIVLGRRPA